MNKDIESYNDKAQRHGYWLETYGDSSIYSKTYWINDKLVGYGEEHYTITFIFFHL